MLGATGVGKTSLVRRYVESMFSEKYQATIGVKIDRKLVDHEGGQVSLLLWDLQGEDDLQKVRTTYLRGAAGLIYVADGTRPDTLDRALAIQRGAEDAVGSVPSLLFVNKSDLADEWAVTAADQGARGPAGVDVFTTSARTGANVEAAFAALVRRMQAP
ncbi:MAG: GTP-binding protein [Gemmatimonadaceae bacterium]|nr:GTP-binding protein [Gemmatimonadaceae bacterium]